MLLILLFRVPRKRDAALKTLRFCSVCLEVNLAVNGAAMLGSATMEGQAHESSFHFIAGIAVHSGDL
jgi:hypothetical protein